MRVKRLLHERAHQRRGRGGVPRINIPIEPDRGLRVGWRPIVSPFRDGFRCYKGSLWWTLNRRSIETMLRFVDEHRGFVRHYRRIQFAPNESFFPTILRNSRELNLVTSDNKRFIRWTRPETGSPDLLRSPDVPAMISSGAHFARKLDSRADEHVLDLIDEQIHAAPAHVRC
jgi:hypothetical protein